MSDHHNTREEFPVILRSDDFFADKSFRLELLDRNPQIPYPLHTHDFSELVIVTGGSGIHFTDQSEYQILPGDVYVIEAGYAHGYRATDQLRLYNIIFDPALVKQAFLDVKEMPGYHAIFNIEPRYRHTHDFNSRLRLSPDELNHIVEHVELLQRELDRDHQGTGSRALALAYFIEIVVTLSRIYTRTTIPDSRMIVRLADAFSYIEHHIDRPIRIEELLEVSGMSHSTLNRAFHKAAGCSPVEYQIRLRIEKACRLLRTTNHSMMTIAEMTGFSDSNYFSRQFRKVMNMSPGAYKRESCS